MNDDASAVVAAWQRGDEAAVYALFADHYPRAVRLGALSGLTQHDAEECAQDAFVRAFERRRQLRDPVAFPLWFHRIVTSQILTLLRRRSRSRDVDLDTAGDLAEDWQRERIPRPDESAIASEQRERLWRDVQSLPPRFRVAVVLRYYGDYSTREIAAILGMREGAVRVTLHRALSRLRATASPPENVPENLSACPAPHLA